MHSDKVLVEESFKAKAESKFFGRQRKADEPFGVYRRLAIAQTTNPATAQVAQDGGVATTLLLFAMEKGVINAALVTGKHPEKAFYPVPKLATNPREVLDCASTKYTCSQSPLMLASEALTRRNVKVGFVGIPCQIQSLRRLQMSDLKLYANLNFSVGLMCSGCFNYDELIEKHIHQNLGVNPNRIKKMNIKRKLLITTDAGVTEIPLSEIKPYMRKACAVCGDFSSELADVSVGGLGLKGWSFTVIRSETGEELFSGAEQAGFLRTKSVDVCSSTVDLLVKLSRNKSNQLRDFLKK
jgi:coenzyme F420 hydrogenase subunit beta